MAGLEEAIKNLLRRHPFVIVNVKGRAKGTSVHELVSILEVSYDELHPLFLFSLNYSFLS